MKMRFLACLLCVFATFAQAQDAPPVDLKDLIVILKQIKEKRAAAEKATVARVLQDFRAAAASNAAAIAFYEQAVGATQYAGKAQAEFQDWKKREADNLKSDAMQNAARLHLSYLLLTIQRAGGMTTKQLEPALLAHIAALTAAGAGDAAILARRDKAKDLKEAGYKPIKGVKPPEKEPLFWEQPLINSGVDGGIFVQWYGITKIFSDIKEWESSPGNVDGMYQKTLLPYFRQNKDPRVIAYWDDKIQQEAQKASSSVLAFKIEQFNKVTRPQLYWKRAQDILTINQRNRAMGEMISLIRNYPDHPDLNNWISTLEGMLAPPAAATPAPSATPNN
ncbi:MAG: hypothetical protein WCO68_04720 [Verrucomicrobiota bacterium]